MNEFLKILLNVRSLRAALRELPFEQLHEAKEKFDQIYQERAVYVEQERAQQEERQRKLNEFNEMLQQAGIDPRELLGTVVAPAIGSERKKREPRPAKYKYYEDGQEKTWTGQGRMPKAIAEQVALGKDLNDFLI
ncbi:MAG: H-NS family nucleoid-associated regulatory protein [Shewanella sp.]